MKILLSIVAASLSLAALTAAPEKKLWAKSYLNQKAPEITVEKWISSKPDLKGKFVLLDFWATWCGPCKKVTPELNAFQKKFGDKLAVIGISDEAEAPVKEYTSDHIKYYSAIDPKGVMKKQYEVTGIPHIVIIDPEGIVRWEGYPFLEGHELNADVVGKIVNGK